MLKLNTKEKNVNEAQLDFYYLSSPAEIEKKLSIIGFNNYQPISYSKIFLKISDFSLSQNKFSTLNNLMKKKSKKNNNIINQVSILKTILETNKKNKILKKSNNFQDRIYSIIFLFFFLILIFSIKIIHISLIKKIF